MNREVDVDSLVMSVPEDRAKTANAKEREPLMLYNVDLDPMPVDRMKSADQGTGKAQDAAVDEWEMEGRPLLGEGRTTTASNSAHHHAFYGPSGKFMGTATALDKMRNGLPPNSYNAHKRDVFISRRELADLLKMDYDDQMTSPQLEAMVLRKIGLAVDEDMMDTIFQECDEDCSGAVSLEELASFLNDIEELTPDSRLSHIRGNLYCSWTFVLLLCLLLAVTLAVAVSSAQLVGHDIMELQFNLYAFVYFIMTIGMLQYGVAAVCALQAQVLQQERAAHRVVRWASKHYPEWPAGDQLLTLEQLHNALAQDNIYIPQAVLKEVYKRIQPQHGKVTYHHVQEYALAQDKSKVSQRNGLVFHANVTVACMKDPFRFWAPMLWPIGSLVLFISALNEYDQSLSSAGYLLFLLAALAIFLPYIQKVAHSVAVEREINGVLLSLISKNGSSKDDLEDNAKRIFKTMDINSAGKAGDGSLEFVELYSALTKAGFVYSTDDVAGLFKEADKSRDGRVQMTEFLHYISNVKSSSTPSEVAEITMTKASKDPLCYALLLQILASIFLLVGNDPEGSAMTLLGWISLFLTTAYWMRTYASSVETKFDNMSSARQKFKREFVFAAKGLEDPAQKEIITNSELAKALGVKDPQKAAFNRRELDRVLLEATRMVVSDADLSTIFAECDVDNSGTVTIDELAAYLNGIGVPSAQDRRQAVLWSSIFTRGFVSCCFFLAAGFLGVPIGLARYAGHPYQGPVNTFGLVCIFLVFGTYTLTEIGILGHKASIENAERIEQKLVDWARRGFKSADKASPTTPTNEDLTLQEFNDALVDSSIYLAYSDLKAAFGTIDKDQSGSLSLNEILEYADEKEKKQSNLSINQKTLNACVKDFWGFWMSWCWVLASISYSVGAYQYGNIPLAWANFFFVAGGFLYTAAALSGLVPYYRNVKRDFIYAQELKEVIRSIARRNGSLPEMPGEDDGGVANRSLKETARKLFEDIDTSNGRPDGRLDFIELNDALTQAGFVIRLDILQSIFKQADSNGDGVLEVREFVNYVAGGSTDVSGMALTLKIIKYLMRDVDFFIMCDLVFASACFFAGSTIGCFPQISYDVVDALYHIGAWAYLVSSVYFTFWLFQGNSDRFDALTLRKLKFKKAMLKRAKNVDYFIPHDEEFQRTFTTSAFSYVVVAPWFTAPFWTAFFVLAMESTLFVIIALSLLGGPPDNPLNLPASVSWEVTVTQIIALLVLILTQNDLVEALNEFSEGYHAPSIKAAFPDASYPKWLLAVFLQGFMGVVSVFVAFLLVVSSSDVVELLLNFTALEFVSMLDDVIFKLASMGYVGVQNFELSELIADRPFMSPVSEQRRRGQHQTLLLFFLVAVVFGYSIIYSQQTAGEYTPSVLAVQFDDSLGLVLGTFSGLYFLEIQSLSYGFDRLRYIGENGKGMFAYCRPKQVWTFSEVAHSDPCEDFIAKSSTSSEFDITLTTGDGWHATDGRPQRRFYPMETFQLASACELDLDCGGVGRGVCEEEQCICNDGFYGIRCDFVAEETCGLLQADTLLGESFIGSTKFADRLELLVDHNNTIIQANHRPVYLGPLNALGEGDVLFYTGLRWGLFRLPAALHQDRNLTTAQNISEYFKSDFATSDDIKLFLSDGELFMSEAVVFNTPSDEATPVGVGWNNVLITQNKTASTPSGALLICAICHDERNPCAHGNTCSEDTGFCECTNGASGPMCRIRPTSNGVCDEDYFNESPFDYDGGDCCEFSCQDTDEATCGFSFVNGTLLNTQFPHCLDPNAYCEPEDGERQCWRPRSHPAPAGSDSYVRMKLSANGRLLVLASPPVLRVLDHTGSQWTQQGDEISDVRSSRLGEMFAIATPPGEFESVVNGLSFDQPVPLILAAVLYRADIPYARVLRWNSMDELWSAIGSDFSLCEGPCVLNEISVGSSGNSVSVAVTLNSQQVNLYTTNYTDAESLHFSFAATFPGNHSSLAANGKVLTTMTSSTTDQTVSVHSVPEAEVLNELSLSADQIGLDDTVQSTELSYDGSLFTIVSSTGLSRFAVQTLFTNSSMALTQPLATDLGTLSQDAILGGLSPVRVSPDGSAIAVLKGGKSSPFIEAYRLDKQYGWIPMGKWSRDYLSLESPFAISSEASELVVGDGNNLEFFAPYPTCTENDASYRFSIQLPAVPGNVSWSANSFLMVGTHRVDTPSFQRSCPGCYDDPTNFGSALVNVQGCARGCMEFTYKDAGNSTETHYSVFANDVLEFSGTGQFSEETVVISPNSEGCNVQPQDCLANETAFVLVLGLDPKVDETSWSLEASGRPLLSGGDYDVRDGFLRVESVCVPKTVDCLDFYMNDSQGDGNRGWYQLFWDGEPVVRREGDSFSWAERATFGACQQDGGVSVAEAKVLTLSVEVPGGYASSVGWYVEDSSVRYLESPLAFTETREVPIFVDELSDCLVLSVEDFAGGSNLVYTMSFQGQIFSRVASFYGEQVRFGPCPLEVTTFALVSFSLSLGNETRWMLEEEIIEADGSTAVQAVKVGGYSSEEAATTVSEMLVVKETGLFKFRLEDASAAALFDGIFRIAFADGVEATYSANGVDVGGMVLEYDLDLSEIHEASSFAAPMVNVTTNATMGS